jgi:hypothetical protein
MGRTAGNPPVKIQALLPIFLSKITGPTKKGTSKNRLFSEVPVRFLALWAAKHAFLSGSSLKTEVFRDAQKKKAYCKIHSPVLE